jgi:hypothetical protein
MSPAAFDCPYTLNGATRIILTIRTILASIENIVAGHMHQHSPSGSNPAGQPRNTHGIDRPCLPSTRRRLGSINRGKCRSIDHDTDTTQVQSVNRGRVRQIHLLT